MNPTVEEGTILGYLTGDVDVALLSDWNVVKLTQEEALEFAQAINPEAFLLEDGTISAPIEEEE